MKAGHFITTIWWGRRVRLPTRHLCTCPRRAYEWPPHRSVRTDHGGRLFRGRQNGRKGDVRSPFSPPCSPTQPIPCRPAPPSCRFPPPPQIPRPRSGISSASSAISPPPSLLFRLPASL